MPVIFRQKGFAFFFVMFDLNEPIHVHVRSGRKLAAVRALANQLHAAGREYSGMAWGWPVHYEPELREDAAEFQVPDGQGSYRTETRPFWSPASFTIGESGVWFYSLLWERGINEDPVEFLDDRNVLASLPSESKP